MGARLRGELNKAREEPWVDSDGNMSGTEESDNSAHHARASEGKPKKDTSSEREITLPEVTLLVGGRSGI